LEAQRTCRELVGRVDPTLLTRSGQSPQQNPAAQQAPDLILDDPLCWRGILAKSSECNSVN
jgi:hypothetical protein